jgi:hypothetical protein
VGTVYVIQEQPRHNLAPAMEYGTIVTLLPPGDANFSVQSTLDELRAGLKDFDSESDWLLLTGDPIAIGLATMVVSEESWRLNFLKWDKQERRYLPIRCKI